MVAGARATVLGATVDLAETANTDGLAEVDVAGDGSGADVVPLRDVSIRKCWRSKSTRIVPVDALGRELLGLQQN